MSILKDIFNELFVSNKVSSKNQNDTSGCKEIIVKCDGRLQRITLNKYGEIVKRKWE